MFSVRGKDIYFQVAGSLVVVDFLKETEHFLEVFKIQVDGIILPQVADRLLSTGSVPMS